MGRYLDVAAVKRITELVYLGRQNGSVVQSSGILQVKRPQLRSCALGGNPHFSGNEFLAATFADFGSWERALSAGEVKQLAGE